MSKLLVLCGALLCLALTAGAQESTAAFDTSSPAAEPAAPASLIPADREPWQLGIGFQYQDFGVLNHNFHNLGFNGDVTRYIANWFGIEGTVVAGFGTTGTTPNLDAKSLLVMGGGHITWGNKTRFEPWGHVLVGMEHFRFTQTSVGLGSNTKLGFMPGGGVDYKITERAFWRVQADFIGSRFGANQLDKSWSVGTGLVFSF